MGEGVDQAAAAVLAGLDGEQAAAVTAPAGLVCILAGAGTGKTRAITHRIAYRVHIGEIQARHVLAVTFTTRAAGEMRARLAALGVPAVQARTFHSAALRQLRYFAQRLLGGPLPEVAESKARLISLAAARAEVRVDQVAIRDLASEIEWAKASLIEPHAYASAAAAARREPPFDGPVVGQIFVAYEEIKRSMGVVDFEDLILAAAWGIGEHPDVADQIRAQYRHFVVDEYQDVNPAQQRLLEAWLGDRDDLTVVGDASQMIYSFTGASASYLLDVARRCRSASGATLVRLVRDYRSTPQVVALANQVIQQSRSEHARLRLELVGQRPPGPRPVLRSYPDEPAEADAVAARCAELISSGVPAHEIAILFRINAQSQVYEEALAERAVAYVVRGAERFFERPEIRQAMAALRAAARASDAADDTGVVASLSQRVVAALAATGWRPDAPPPGGAARERWEALAALVRLADQFALAAGPSDPPTGAAGPRSLVDYSEELTRRAALQQAPTVDGVTLASLHSAKGLEWDAVFLVGLVEGVLPSAYAQTPQAIEEERRLLYVGITRARQWLTMSYAEARNPGGRSRAPSRLLPQVGVQDARSTRRRAGSRDGDGHRRRPVVASCRVCGAVLTQPAARKLGRCPTCPSTMDEELFARLREWRYATATAAQVPPYVVFTDATLTALAERRPGSVAELIDIAGIGPHKLDRYGQAVLALVAGARPADVTVLPTPAPGTSPAPETSPGARTSPGAGTSQ